MKKNKKSWVVSWKVPARRRQCGLCAHKFILDESVYSSLGEEKEGVFERTDLCHACWSLQEVKNIYWRTTVSSCVVQESLPPSQKAWEFLKEAVESQEVKTKHLAFLLAQLMLRRKQVIRKLSSQDSVLMLENPKTQESVPVEKVAQVSSLPLDELFKDVELILSGS